MAATAHTATHHHRGLPEPPSMHGMVYLLAHDLDLNRIVVGRPWLLGFALRAAMMTDLTMAGYLHDIDGRAHRAGSGYPRDALLSEALGTLDCARPASWDTAIAREQATAATQVSSQLTEHGWLQMRHRRILGIFPQRRLWLADEPAVRALTDRVRTTLRDAIHGRPADARPLTVGLIGALAELSSVLPASELMAHQDRLTVLIDEAAGPVRALRRAVEQIQRERRNDNLSTSAAGGCGGGCGGCGGCGCGG